MESDGKSWSRRRRSRRCAGAAGKHGRECVHDLIPGIDVSGAGPLQHPGAAAVDQIATDSVSAGAVAASGPFRAATVNSDASICAVIDLVAVDGIGVAADVYGVIKRRSNGIGIDRVTVRGTIRW